MQRTLVSLLLSSLINLAIAIFWISSRSFWQYDWQVDDILLLIWPLLVIYAFSALGVAIMLPLLAFLAKKETDARIELIIAFTVAAMLGYLMMIWAPKIALLGAIFGMVAIACLRLVAPAFFRRTV